MTSLQKLLGHLAELEDFQARFWAGPIQQDGTHLIADIVGRIGLDALGREADFTEVPAADAHIWLVFYATRSMMFGSFRLHDGLLEKAASTLAEMGDGFRYFSKGEWVYSRRGLHYEQVRDDGEWKRRRHHVDFQTGSGPLWPTRVEDTPQFLSYVDGGLVGYGAETAFVFWVEESD